MTRKASSSNWMPWLFISLAACGGKTLATSGGTAGAPGATSGSGGVPGSTGGSTPAASPCEQGCGSGYDCFPFRDGMGGFCAPHCNWDPYASEAPSCENAVSGGPGICLPFCQQLDGCAGGANPVGVCTRRCNPLVQDCPEHFVCEVAELPVPVGAVTARTFACLPLIESKPRPLGASCDGAPIGECAPGLSCVWDGNPGEYTCLAFCDLQDPASCPKPRRCSRPAWFPGDQIGLCID